MDINISSTQNKLREFKQSLDEATTKRDKAAQQFQAKKDKLSARQRILKLLDKNSFNELDCFVKHRSLGFGLENKHILSDAVIIGTGRINGKEVAVFSQDFSAFGGSLGEVAGEKIVKIMQLALNSRIPIIGILDSGGARIQEGVISLSKYGDIFRLNTACSGVIPQISIVLGPSAGGACYSPALTDFVIMADKTSNLFVTGPDVIKTVTGEEISKEELGGAATHSEISGVCNYRAKDEDDALDFAKVLLSYLPQNNKDAIPKFRHETTYKVTDKDKSLNSLIPDSSTSAYDMKKVIEVIVDGGEFLEISASFAPNIITSLARIEGKTVGIIANQPKVQAGTLNIDASEKAARFVRFLDAFNIPIITLVDVPGYLPGKDQEFQGIIRRGAKLLYAYAEATSPVITLITRKAYGGAYIVMGSKTMGADFNFAWPTAEIAVMGASGAVNILYRKELSESDEPTMLADRLSKEYAENFASPYLAASRGLLDDIIMPESTRLKIINALRVASSKKVDTPKRKHGNIPL